MRGTRALRGGAGRTLLLFGTAFPIQLMLCGPASASGFYLQEQSVRGWGRANSGEVADSGPGSLWWNPAANARDEETSSSFGATAILPQGRLRDEGTLLDRPGVAPIPVGGPAVMRDPIQKGLLPGSAASKRLGEGLALGFVIASPFSFTSDYEAGGWQRYSGIRTRLFTLNLQPSLAWSPDPRISVGAALNVQYADSFLSNALPNIAPGSPDGRFEIEGRDWSFGWSAGVQLRPAPRLTLGLAYKSAITHHLKGPVEISGLAGPLAARNLRSPTVVNFSLPWQLAMGARAGLGERTTFNLQAVRFGWSKFDSLDFAAPINNSIAEDYKDVWSLAAGFDHALSSRLTLRAGVQLDQTPTRDSSRDARVPDGDRVNYNIGSSFRLSERLTLDAAASLTDIEDVPIARSERFYAGTAAQTDVLTAGRAADARVFILALGGRMVF